MPQELIQINVRKPPMKLVLILFLLVASAWSFFVVRWYLGNTLAEYFNPADDNLNLAHTVVSLAPGDPLTHWRLAQLSQKQLSPDQQAQGIAEYEKAVSLSPNDYRYWMALGIAQEQSGDINKGELALRRAVALAPSYAYPHWYLGNLLLRAGRYDEAFSEIRIASDAEPQLRPQLFRLIWEIYGSDTESVKKAIGQNPVTRSELALYLMTQKKFDEGLAIWNSLNPEEMKANRSTAESIAKALVAELRFQDALNIVNGFVTKPAQIGQVLDGGFEADPRDYAWLFGWQVQGASQMQIGIDPARAYSGTHSLRLMFQVRARLDNLSATQLVAMQPDKEYEFECYVRTDKLQSGSTPQVQIVDATNNNTLATSAQAPAGDHDWERIGLSFKTGPKTQAVLIKIVRGQCGEEATTCPIFGAVWYDDFSFKSRN
jgi:tetratricopeptide (TPR) repeat protein